MSEYLRKNWVWIGGIITIALAIVGMAVTIWLATKPFENSAPRLDANLLARALLAHQQGGAEGQNLTGQNVQDQLKQLTEVVEALKKEREEKDAPPGIDAALKQLRGGDTKAAEAIFEAVKQRKKGEGREALKEAAAAAKHIGALAYLHNTDKALDAYREATELDPDDADAWNWFGILLSRIGDLDGAERTYGKVLALGNLTSDKQAIAAANGNLGNLAQTRGDMDKAEDYYQKSLDLYEELGRKKGMAVQYVNLGTLAQIRGYLDEAEDYYQKSLALYEELDSKEGMASNYGNLGLLAHTRGEYENAVGFSLKALDIFKELGHKEGLASVYGNLGILAKTRGDLDEAEDYYQKSLDLDEKLGRKEGMGSQYFNLGILAKTRGDMGKACQTWIKALALFEQVGARPQIEQARALMAKNNCPSPPDGSG